MNIFELDDIRYEISKNFNYKQFHKLCRVNKNLNHYYTNKIHDYQSSYEKTLKMFDIDVLLCNYYIELTKQINHQYCTSLPNGNKLLHVYLKNIH